jgi:hypothetical protein
MIRTLAIALLSCSLLTAAHARDVEAGTVLICDTQHQAERVASLIHGDGSDVVNVVSDVNAEENSPSACGVADVTYLRGANLATIRSAHETFDIAKIMVMGVITPNGVQDVSPRFYFLVTKVDERMV